MPGNPSINVHVTFCVWSSFCIIIIWGKQSPCPLLIEKLTPTHSSPNKSVSLLRRGTKQRQKLFLKHFCFPRNAQEPSWVNSPKTPSHLFNSHHVKTSFSFFTLFYLLSSILTLICILLCSQSLIFDWMTDLESVSFFELFRCADGYMGQRCEFKDLDGSYLRKYLLHQPLYWRQKIETENWQRVSRILILSEQRMQMSKWLVLTLNLSSFLFFITCCINVVASSSSFLPPTITISPGMTCSLVGGSRLENTARDRLTVERAGLIGGPVVAVLFTVIFIFLTLNNRRRSNNNSSPRNSCQDDEQHQEEESRGGGRSQEVWTVEPYPRDKESRMIMFSPSSQSLPSIITTPCTTRTGGSRSCSCEGRGIMMMTRNLSTTLNTHSTPILIPPIASSGYLSAGQQLKRELKV